MTPDTLAQISQIITVLERVSTWPFASLFLVLVIGPWVMSLVNSYTQRRQIEQAVQMYKDNVVLVRAYEALAKDQRDTIMLNTEAWIGVRDAIQRNEFCPVVRSRLTSHGTVTFEAKKEGDR